MDLNSIQKNLAALAASANGRLGVYAIDTGNDVQLHYHANERFPMCSTAKMMVVAAILKKSMSDRDLLKQCITYMKKDLVDYSPVTEKHLKGGMTIDQLCAAAMTISDNTAMNLLMKELGGPKAADIFARSIGDDKFKLDRYEPELNSAIPGDSRDTTTPAAMAKSLQRLALGDVLAPAQRKQLQTWLKNNTTGNARIRAGVPKGWLVGDKTGTGMYGTTNDIGIIWPPHCAPIVIAIYFTQDKKDAAPRDQVLASATHVVLNGLAHSDSCLDSNYIMQKQRHHI